MTPHNETKIRVFLVDDHDVIRAGMRAMLEAEDDIEIAGEARTAGEALALIPEIRPTLSILDLRLPDGNGVDLCQRIMDIDISLHCLLLTSFADNQAIVGAARSGALGYVLKGAPSAAIIDAVRRAAGGENLMRMAGVDPVTSAKDSVSHEKPLLTDQDIRILDLIAAGCTNGDIARQTHLSEKTVANYVSTILAKLGVTRRAQAAVYAVSRRRLGD